VSLLALYDPSLRGRAERPALEVETPTGLEHFTFGELDARGDRGADIPHEVAHWDADELLAEALQHPALRPSVSLGLLAPRRELLMSPAALPAISRLIEKLGGGDPLQIALSINIGAVLVDVSPISTPDALCVAALPHGEDAKRLFRQLLLWGLSMTVAGALFCPLFIRLFAF
jgi:hypothetical protein